MNQAFRLGDIKPNPYRNIDKYPIRRATIDELKASIAQTGFWGGIVVRINTKGQPEQAFGHHRLVAAIEALGPDHVRDFEVVAFDNTQMLQAMASENMATYTSDAAIDVETLRALLGAWASGEVTPKPVIPAKAREVHRFAQPTGRANIEYVPSHIAAFFGWSIGRRVPAAIAALEAIEAGHFAEEDLSRRSQRQTEAMTDAVKRAAVDGPEVQKAVAAAVAAVTAPKASGKAASEQEIAEVGAKAQMAARPKTATTPPPIIPSKIVNDIANRLGKLAVDIATINDLLIANPTAAPMVRNVKAHSIANVLGRNIERLTPELNMLRKVVVTGHKPVARPNLIESGQAPANLRIVS